MKLRIEEESSYTTGSESRRDFSSSQLLEYSASVMARVRRTYERGTKQVYSFWRGPALPLRRGEPPRVSPFIAPWENSPILNRARDNDVREIVREIEDRYPVR
jgi:hypothetical protein